MTWAITVGVLVLLAGAGYFVVQWIRRSQSNAVRVEHLDAAVRAGEDRVRARDSADAARRDRERKEFDGKAREVRTADDAARLLRDLFPARGTKPSN